MSGETNTSTAAGGSASGRVKVADCDYDVVNGDIDFSFKNGHGIKVNLSQFSEGIVREAALRGIMETCRDTYAGSKGNVLAAIESCQGRIDTLLSGIWKANREGTGEGSGAMWIEAVARYKGWDLPTARQKMYADGMDDAKRKSIRESAPIKKLVAELRLEKAQAALAAAQADSASDGEDVLASLN